ncbi:hypothetical protein EVAR_28481_1 [Eumeta japonica]|uniref:Uncharacterized protein n=1 Tax=Eumeta variegata TaxID=151549 RepID=A0A4C1WS50_EUMVA|nr:hypothetical protein EVAR_28481_1 [Eumeta japonica]
MRRVIDSGRRGAARIDIDTAGGAGGAGAGADSHLDRAFIGQGVGKTPSRRRRPLNNERRLAPDPPRMKCSFSLTLADIAIHLSRLRLFATAAPIREDFLKILMCPYTVENN